MERTHVSILFGSFTVALIELASCSPSASAGWIWKSNKCAPACATTESEQCVPSTPAAPMAPAAPAAPVAAPPPAVFQTPQATSDISGPSESVGIRGFGIRFPEANLQLPTIQLPSVVRYRRGSEAHFESARAPQIAGMAAVPSQLAPGGPAIPVAPAAAPMAPPMAPQPPSAPAAPAAPMNCVPHAALDNPSTTELAAMRELMETRRVLDLYRQELAELKRSLDSAPATASDDSNIPPAPSARRISYQTRPATAVPTRRPAAAKIVEAGYIEDDLAEEEFDDVRPARQMPNRRVSVEQFETSQRTNTGNQRSLKIAERPNVGHSYPVDESDTDLEGLGTWKSEQLRPLTTGRFGAAPNRRPAN